MTFEEITKYIDSFKSNYTTQSFLMHNDFIIFNNEYITVRRIDTNNKTGGVKVKAGKCWSIIINLKKSFTHLRNWKLLKHYYDDDLAITEVKYGKLEGCYGIRFYRMSDNPTEEIIKEILRFIFAE